MDNSNSSRCVYPTYEVAKDWDIGFQGSEGMFHLGLGLLCATVVILVSCGDRMPTPSIDATGLYLAAQVSRSSWSASLLRTAARPAGRHPVNLLLANLSLLSLSRLSSDSGIWPDR